MNKKITVIGSSNTDLVVKTDRFAQPGETLLAQDFFMFPGGKGANQAVAASRLGGDVTFICKIGNDLFGQKSLEGFKQEGIDTSYVLTDDSVPSGVALITVDSKGENTILVASGSNFTFNPEDIRSLKTVMIQSAIILIQLEIPLPTILAILDIAKENKITVILNPAPARPLDHTILSNIDFLTPNEHEAEILTGIPVFDEESAKQAAESLHLSGTKNVIITLGEQGAYASTPDFKGILHTTKVIPVDTTAAGDVFNGALAVAISNHHTLEYAIQFACKAATLSVTRMGAQSSAPYVHEINV